MSRDNEEDQPGRWSTPKIAALNISESKKRTIKRRRIVKKIKDSPDEFSDSDNSMSAEESEMRAPLSSMRIEKDEEASTIMDSPGDACATLPKPGDHEGNDTFNVEEEDYSPRSDEAVIIPKTKSKRVARARAKVVNYDPTRDSSLESSSMEDYPTEIRNSSDENLNRTKTFATKSNRRNASRMLPNASRNVQGYDSFEDLFNDPIVPNQTFPSAKKKAKPKSKAKKREPRKSEHWSPVPIAHMRGLRNSDKSLKFKSREDGDKENFMSETAPVQNTLNSRRSAGDSAWRTRNTGSPSQTRTLVRGNKTHTLHRAAEDPDKTSPSKTRTLVRGNKTHTIYRAADDAERTSPSKTRTLVRGSDKTHTVVRASNKTHTIVKGRRSEQQKPVENHSELEATRGKKKKQSKPSAQKLTYWKDVLSSESSDLSSSESSSDEESDESSDDEFLLQKRNLQRPVDSYNFLFSFFDDSIKDHLENVPAYLFDSNTDL